MDDLSKLIELIERPGGLSVIMKPGASRIPLDRVLAYVLSKHVPGFDLERFQAAWRGSDGKPVSVVRGSDPVPLPPSLPPPNASQPAITGQEEISAGSISVLLSGAHEKSLLATETVLAARGVNVRRSVGLDGAVREATQSVPDAVIVDAVDLGGSQAMEICRRLSANPRTSGSPILVCCKVATKEFVGAALKAGARDLMVHPATADVLTRKVAKILEFAGKALPEQIDPNEARGGLSHPARRRGKLDMSKLLADITDLQPIPPVVERVVRISDSANAGAAELAQAVAMDATATALVLQVANSAGYAAARQITSLAEAVGRIGFAQTRNLVVGKGLSQAIGGDTRSDGFDRVMCWKHALATAILTELISKLHRRSPGDISFIAGLLHDVGLLLLDQFCPGDLESAILKGIEKGIPLADAEREFLELTHEELAVHALQGWQFPEEIVEAAKFHHGRVPAGMPEPRQFLCHAVYAANLMAKAIGLGLTGNNYIAEVPNQVWDLLALENGVDASFWAKFEARFGEDHAFLGMAYKEGVPFDGRRGAGLICERDAPRISLLRLIAEAEGWRTTHTSVESLATMPSPEQVQFVIVRAEGSASMVACMKRCESVFGSVPIVGVLPSGGRAPEGRPCLVEPYDRDALIKLLPQAESAPPQAESAPA